MTPIELSLKDAQHALHRIEIRPLTGEDAQAYFALRQRILSVGDGHYFSDSYTREAELKTEHERRDWCREKPEHCIIGAFTNGQLSGIVMITRFGPIEDSTVEWEATWVDPKFRRTGLTKALYEQVRNWTIDQGYAHVKVFIRSDNTRWLDIRLRQGFVQTGTKRNELWADGTTGDTHTFKLDLCPQHNAERAKQAIQYLGQTLAAISKEPGELPTRAGEGPTSQVSPGHQKYLRDRKFG
ncbi:GNAT family N-acetyltransferase [Bradyrhizobium diazoefficiens]|nr:GNAT family N-acetyltransferase [Bradyrhizobium diazoefficiens]MBR0967869.1 GNAT family N-acetyltransferase [Bradyrhizobium diazoefficiens]MBR0981263.1 GNAT family N-acetyltransferase [Bradyrhizobium diazoefficiens]MBR1010720.1 GNAT family N-acetyltransferase [Bradyrhizobium diazoefficiens]MBR1015727.1 GNAT family N-acetyltransferase [Bradyrhizobium diazoefficiens]MBR1054713.1 GNAT family N-acetyltransferase [Bradyrhizobium diazoefficiens]